MPITDPGAGINNLFNKQGLCMKKLHLFILKTYTGPLISTFFVVVFILLMQFLWKYIDDLIGKGLEFSVIAELLLYTSAGLVPLALPLAILLSSLMTFGNMGENFELTALKSAGISLQRIMRPLIILTIIISVGAFYFSNHILPYTNLKMRSLLFDVQQQRPEMQIREGIFYNGIENYSIRIADKNHRTNMMYNIKIYDHSDRRGNLKVTVADSGFMRITSDKGYLVTTLYSGYNYEEMEERARQMKNRSYPHRNDRFDEQTLYIELSGFDLQRTDEEAFRHNSQMMNISQLDSTTDSLSVSLGKEVNEHTRGMVKSYFFKKEALLLRDSVPADARRPADIWSLEKEQTLDQKRRALDQAAVDARMVRNQIISTKINFDWQNKRIRRYEMEWHRKFTLSFACFIFFFIGAPLGAIIRKGGLGMPVVISVLFFVLYYVIDISAQKFVKELVIPAFPGMWISSFILLPAGIFLTYKATTDSAIMNTDTYLNLLRKLFNVVRKPVKFILPDTAPGNENSTGLQ
jgi:lipopolysaccharide export system permease protein